MSNALAHPISVRLHTQSDSPGCVFLEVTFCRPYSGGGDPVADQKCDALLSEISRIAKEEWSEADREVGDDEWYFKVCVRGASLGRLAGYLADIGYDVSTQRI